MYSSARRGSGGGLAGSPAAGVPSPAGSAPPRWLSRPTAPAAAAPKSVIPDSRASDSSISTPAVPSYRSSLTRPSGCRVSGQARPPGTGTAASMTQRSASRAASARVIRTMISSCGASGPPPEVVWVAAGAEALGPGHVRGRGEAPGQHARVVRVAAEADRVAAAVVPPADDPRVRGDPGVDLQGPAGRGQGTQHRAEVLLQRGRVELPVAAGPGADRVVDVGQHREAVRTLDEAADLGQVGAD